MSDRRTGSGTRSDSNGPAGCRRSTGSRHPGCGRYLDILVVDLLGGLGDLLMILPAIHCLARRNPGAALRVLTHEPGAELVRHDPAVTEVRVPGHVGAGAEREAVLAALIRRRPDLVVSTTRYDGIPDLLESSGARCVTDLWRAPPPNELVAGRYLRILYEEALLEADDLETPPRVYLRPDEVAGGHRLLAAYLPADHTGRPPPVVLVPEAGMAVKRWPQRHWREVAALLRDAGHPVLAVTPVPGPVIALPRLGLRELAACFAALGRRGAVVVGGDTGPVRLAAATATPVVTLFGPTLASRYGMGAGGGVDVQGLPDCSYRRPTAITEQVCWWDGQCPLSAAGPLCLADISPARVAGEVFRLASSTPGMVR